MSWYIFGASQYNEKDESYNWTGDFIWIATYLPDNQIAISITSMILVFTEILLYNICGLDTCFELFVSKKNVHDYQ